MAEEGQVLVLPEGLDVKTAAAIPEAWGTAYQILNFVGGLTSGDTVLVFRAFESVVCSVAPCGLQIACHRSTLLAVVSGRLRLRYESRPTVAVCCAEAPHHDPEVCIDVCVRVCHQLAVDAKAKVIATAGQPEKLATAKR